MGLPLLNLSKDPTTTKGLADRNLGINIVEAARPLW